MELTKDILFEEFITNNLSAAKIGEKYGYRKTQIYGMLEKYHIRKGNKNNYLTEDFLLEEYINKNKSIKEISSDFGFAETTILRYLNKFNIKKDAEVIKANKIEKTKKTNLERYGFESAVKNDRIRNKIKLTNISTYSDQNIKLKIKQSFINKYGVENPMLDNDIKNKYKNSCIKNFGYDNPTKNPEFRTYITSTEYSFYITKNTINNNFINNTILEFSDIFKEFGILNYKVKVFGNDIYFYFNDILIRFYNSEDHTEKYIQNHNTHKNEQLYFNKNKFNYFIFSHEWKNNKVKIKNHLKNILNKNSIKIQARKCIVKEIDISLKKDFLKENHLQGNDNSIIRLGLFYSNILISVMTFVKPRFNKKYDWELSRYCSKCDMNVIGGASKLFKYFVNNYMKDSETVLSYSDSSKSKGNIYKILGFDFIEDSPPNYIWFKSDSDYIKRYKANKYKQERSIMTNKGYSRLFNCGNKVWIYKKQ